MTSPQVEVQTTERAILCANGKIHYGEEHFKEWDAATLLAHADVPLCGPHSFATRERIVTAWTEGTP